MITGPKRALSVIEADLAKAHFEYEEAAQTSRTANAEETRCLNNLNDLQIEFDAAVEVLRKSGGHRTHWGEAVRRRMT